MDAEGVAAKRRFNIELVVVILLGIASVATAYASFQSSLWDSVMASNYTRGQNTTTAAESIYLEANQQYVQDAQTYSQLVILGVEALSSDSELVLLADTKIEALTMTAVDEVLDSALAWSNASGDYPLNSDDYLEARFGEYRTLQAEAATYVTAGDEANGFGDRLTLYTVLLAIALFLLGIAAVVSSMTIKRSLIVIGGVITAVAIILTTLVPFTAVG